jgi:hypothetical protein
MTDFANPASAQMRVGFEAANSGLGDVGTFQDMRFRSETLGAELPLIQDDSIAPFGEEAEGEQSKIDPSGAINVNWMTEDHAKLLAAFFGAGATPVDLGGAAAYRHRMQVTETDVSFGRLAIEVSRDRGRPDYYTGAIPSQLSFSIASRGFLTGSAQLVMPRFMHHDDPTVVAGTGPTPYIRGLYGYDDLALATADLGDLFLEITAHPGTGGADFDVKAKIGTAGVQGAAIPITVGNDADGNPIFTDLLHTASDVHVGQGAELPISVHFKTATGSALADEWRFARRRDVWTQTLPVKSLCNEISASIEIAGTKTRLKNVGLTLTRPVALDEAIGGRFSDFSIEQGERTAVWTLSRRALGLDLANRLLAGEPASMELNCLSTLVSGSVFRRQMYFVSMNCLVEGRTSSIAGRQTFDETITLRAHPNNDATYPSAIALDLVNTQADLNP